MASRSRAVVATLTAVFTLAFTAFTVAPATAATPATAAAVQTHAACVRPCHF
ncbi:hypothetical protein VSH64_46405 [Amycolatopsis rhabdoformis]|uniref:Uncharacterized protein n=1 Tax=Amycolatopsis rhabdoformis TaxID=1448059 RepID=A0ABZ1I6X3_9PSEU|nr:hypothetical protein [Amycolatopsis rhabdoformis]WSE30148.1 hypothetical protein VSH64_46405 [Amycolatopsis rhabdoformis]